MTWQKWVFFLCFISVCLVIPAGVKRLTCGFHRKKIEISALASDPRWETVSFFSDKKAAEILSQKFRYFDKGLQCYVFLSEDEKYVLKLFRFDRQRRFFSSKKQDLKNSFQLFESCKLANELAPEETGLVYLHLNLTQGKFPWLQAKDPLGRFFTIPLDRYRFALQRKAEPFAKTLFIALREGVLEQRVQEISALLEKRIEKGIGNRDPSLWRNFGFFETQAVEIDFGNYVIRPDFITQGAKDAEKERYMEPLRAWILKHRYGLGGE